MNDHRQRMLLVEDHKETRTLLRRMLTRHGWEVSEAGTIAEGLAQLDPPPAGLVLDMELPDGDGETILRKVRQERLPTRIVVQTGLEDPSRIDQIINLRPDRLLRKPLDPEALRAICGLAEPPEATASRVDRPGDPRTRIHGRPPAGPRPS